MNIGGNVLARFYKLGSGGSLSVGGPSDNSAVGIFVNATGLGNRRALVARAGQNQSANIFEAQSSGNAALVSVTALGSLVVGSEALAANATDGFLYMPTCAGAPAGVPTGHGATVAALYDTKDDRIYVYNGGWKSVGLS
jgi:hypothetical protein